MGIVAQFQKGQEDLNVVTPAMGSSKKRHYKKKKEKKEKKKRGRNLGYN